MPSTQNCRVLLVDDSPEMKSAIKTCSKDLPMDLVIADTGGALALRLFQETRFDAVLMDFHLPDMDGAEVIWQLRSLAANGE